MKIPVEIPGGITSYCDDITAMMRATTFINGPCFGLTLIFKDASGKECFARTALNAGFFDTPQDLYDRCANLWGELLQIAHDNQNLNPS